MQLNEILEENSLKAISSKTKIPENHIEKLIEGNFNTLKKVKTLGFLSILEREYKADLSALRNQALEYYDQNSDDDSASMAIPITDTKRSKSKWIPYIVIALLILSSWYFFTQFDKKQLADLLPFSEDTLSEMILPDANSSDLSLEDIQLEEDTAKAPIVIDGAVESVGETNKTDEINSSIKQ